jgi:FMN-dependent oxidoreductase (nitrilotriacetate monooxygenase family)
MQHGVSPHSVGMWRHPLDKVGFDYSKPPYWQHLSRTMERGLFDAIFLADELAPYCSFEGSSDATVEYAVQSPTHEPAALVTIISGATENLGVGITLSTAFEHPYSMARRLSTLDHLTGGRVAWNVVGSYSPSEWSAYGVEMPDRALRYERIDEYVSLCCELWESWRPGAVIADKGSGVFADPRLIKEVDFAGKYFRCRARHSVSPSPQGKPVLWQAGSSPAGRDFAARTADAVFAIQPSIEAMRDYTEDMKVRIAKAGRDPAKVKLFYGIQPIVGMSEHEASEKAEYIRSLVHPGASMAMLSGQLGVDFSQYHPMTALADVPVPGIQGVKDALVGSGVAETVTVAEAAETYAFRFAMPQVVGTASSVADQLVDYMDHGGADGFMLLATYTPGCFEEFVNLVVPELQRRGRYRHRYPGKTLRDNISHD